MGFSLQVSEEAAHIFPDSNCCRLAELSALLKMRGSILTYGNNNIGLQIIGENATVIRKVYTYIRELFDLEMQLVVLKKRRLSKNNIYMIRIMPGQDVKNMLIKTGFLTLDNRLSSTISHKLCKNLCCIKSYMRGVFLGGGSITDPVRSYHLELNTKDILIIRIR